MTCQAVTLADYAARIGYCECSFFGVYSPDCDHYECRDIWTLAQRNDIASYLAQAQELIESELGYFLCPKWVTDERHEYARVLMTKWGYLIAGGVMSDTVIQAGAAVNHAADPATITVGGVTCNCADLHVYYPGTCDEIKPLTMSITAGVLTITIPWCRMVAPAYQSNPPEGLALADVATWISHTVDVHCISNDTTTQAHHIVGPHHCGTDCTETEHDACIYVRRATVGSVSTKRTASSCGHCAQWVDLNYLSGLTTLPKTAEDMIIRLAHSLMPAEPCGCDWTKLLWQRDRTVPTVLTRERINSSFGLSDGAWFAWQWAQSHKLRRGSVL
jgi:hypothetical protein